MIEIKENVNNVKEFNFLYDEVGWGHFEENISSISLNNTFYSVSIYDDDNIIGFGRIIGDSICFLYIQDVMVLPKYQGKKIGSMIMNNLLNKISEIRKVNPYVRTYVGGYRGIEKFYERFGFVTRKDYGLGEEMILKI